jgi:hypothetical protein
MRFLPLVQALAAMVVACSDHSGSASDAGLCPLPDGAAVGCGRGPLSECHANEYGWAPCYSGAGLPPGCRPSGVDAGNVELLCCLCGM